MKSCTLFLYLIIISIPVSAQTLDEIISRHLEAMGHENLLNKNSLIAKARIIQGGTEIPVISYYKRTDKFRMDSSIQEYTFTQAYDGNRGWLINPMMNINEPMELPPSEVENLKFQTDLDGFFYNYQNKNYTLEYAGNDKVSGSDTYLILLTKISGDSMYFYIDTENYLILKTRSKASVGGDVKYIENIYSDYRKVDGILSVYNIKTQVEGMTFTELIYESYDYSTEVPDSIFIFKQEVPEELPESGVEQSD